MNSSSPSQVAQKTSQKKWESPLPVLAGAFIMAFGPLGISFCVGYITHPEEKYKVLWTIVIFFLIPLFFAWFIRMSYSPKGSPDFEASPLKEEPSGR